MPIAPLRGAAIEGTRLLQRQAGVLVAEVFASENLAHTIRLHYTSHLPCNGVEEPKTCEFRGVAVRALFEGPDGPRIGFGSEASDLSTEGVRLALEKAERNAVRDPQFRGFPPLNRASTQPKRYHDPTLARLSDRALVGLGWDVVRSALKTFGASEHLAAFARGKGGMADLGLILSGDVTAVTERMAIGRTDADGVSADETTLLMAYVTAMVEADQAKGTSTFASSRLADFSGQVGVEAAENAIRCLGGRRLASGEYPVILGPQAMADVLNNLVVPSVTAGAFYSASSAFSGKMGVRVASPVLTLADDGAAPGLMGTKALTCEGLPTGRTELIAKGRLVGLIASHYDGQKLIEDPSAEEKTGLSPSELRGRVGTRNGFRYGSSPGRHFTAPPQTAATNVIVEEGDSDLPSLLKQMGNGLYVGRIWYTYPINGLRNGDFTSTVVGDSFVVRGGQVEAPLRANTVRINDNVRAVLERVRAVGRPRQGVVVWASDEVCYSPPVWVDRLRLEEIDR
ncbi:MAG: TldD/PmbA family protein [Nitrospirae bacterium]|nr:TldD/PmbA family protein [Nitrospirota bacterium]